jgi:hypothetical protein
MPLDDREQRILEEIERQFYQEDPKLAQTVRKTNLAVVTARRVRWASLAVVGGLVVMLLFFTSNRFIALAGFLVMTAATVWIVSVVRARSGWGSVANWTDRTRQRWRRGG